MSQNERILEHLKLGYPLTPMRALERWGVFRLASRIRELRDCGYRIACRIVVKGGKRVGEYRLVMQ